MSEIKDSGNRREFSTGAVRDVEVGKGRMDLLPACAVIRLSKHFENGARKYEERNWEKGIPVHSFIDSALRHLMKYLDGWDDEDHLCAAAWNCMCAMWTEEKRPELQDIPTRTNRTEEKVTAPVELHVCANCQKRVSGRCYCSKGEYMGTETPDTYTCEHWTKKVEA